MPHSPLIHLCVLPVILETFTKNPLFSEIESFSSAAACRGVNLHRSAGGAPAAFAELQNPWIQKATTQKIKELLFQNKCPSDAKYSLI